MNPTPLQTRANEIAERLAIAASCEVIATLNHKGLPTKAPEKIVLEQIPLPQLIAVALAADSVPLCNLSHDSLCDGLKCTCWYGKFYIALQDLRTAGGVL